MLQSKQELIALILVKKIYTNKTPAFKKMLALGLLKDRRTTNKAEIASMATAAAVTFLKKHIEFEVTKDLRVYFNIALKDKDFILLYYKRLFEHMHTANTAKYQTERLYKLFVSIGTTNAKLGLLSMAQSNTEFAAANYFLASCISGGFTAGLRAVQNFRHKEGGLIESIEKANLDFLLVLDTELNNKVKNFLIKGDFFVFGLSDRKFSAETYDITLYTEAATAEIKQLFLELSISGLLFGMQRRSEFVAFNRLGLFYETILY